MNESNISKSGSTLLEMNKEDFQSKYPNHGDKFFDAFRQLIHQIQNQQQQQHHSPSTIETSATDLLGLQSKLFLKISQIEFGCCCCCCLLP